MKEDPNTFYALWTGYLVTLDSLPAEIEAIESLGNQHALRILPHEGLKKKLLIEKLRSLAFVESHVPLTGSELNRKMREYGFQSKIPDTD